MSLELTLFNICRSLHIVVGALAAFVAFPCALFSAKGSRFHRKAGYAAVVLSVLVAITGTCMLVNPLFDALWLKNERARGTDWVLFFDESLYEPHLFMWLNVLLLYFCFSGVRVWIRVASVRKGGPSFGTVDIVLCAILMVSSSLTLFGGCWNLWHRSFHPFAYVYVEVSLYAMLFGVVDILSFFAPQRYLIDWGFALHGYKFFCAWSGLMTAFMIRLKLSYGALKTTDTLYGFFVHALILLMLWRYFVRTKASHTRLDSANRPT